MSEEAGTPGGRKRRQAAVRASHLLAESLAEEDVEKPSVPAMEMADAAALLRAAQRDILVVSGSGISAASGLSTFSCPSSSGRRSRPKKKTKTASPEQQQKEKKTTTLSVYERARRKFKLKEGMELFHWRFYASRPYDALSFLGDLCEQARRSEPTTTHRSLRLLEDAGKLRRHFTMNIDGLAARAGMSTWNEDEGRTVELHGSVLDLVDVETGHVYDVDDRALARIRRKLPAFDHAPPTPKRTVDLSDDDDEHTEQAADDAEQQPTTPEGEEAAELSDEACRVRFRVMFYGDREHACVLDAAKTLRLLADDAAHATLVLWLGISFQQSASCDYLRRVVRASSNNCVHLVVNPDPDAATKARAALDVCSDLGTADLRALYATTDDLFLTLHHSGSASHLQHNVATADLPPVASSPLPVEAPRPVVVVDVALPR